jgi:hypothetical protein
MPTSHTKSASTAAILLLLGAMAATPLRPASAQAPPRRAILISFDGFSEQRVREYADSLSAPTIWSMFRDGVCAESVRPAFPSVTPVGHASIYTGAYGNVTGVTASSRGALPLQSTTILDYIDGFSAQALRAEPIWITAARQGKSVFGHFPTQSPQPPGYEPINAPSPALDSARARAAATLAKPNVAVVNMYNDLVAPARVVRTPAEMSWAFGEDGDSLRARARDDSTVAVELVRDPSRAVLVHLAATDTTSPRGRALARFFSEPLRIDLPRGRRTFVYFRLFELARDRSRLLLYVSEARVLQANRPEVAAAYDDAVRGVPGNGGGRPMERGELGPRVQQGGDGTAEYRYMETVELVTRQFMRGTDWGWRTYRPELATDYFPYPDETLHTFLGFADPGTPNVSDAARKNAARMLKRAYTIIDLRLEQMRRLASSEPNTRLFVTGEHGMRPAWLTFKPNVVLRAAGILRADSAGKIDLAHTQAAATRGSWISVNRVGRKGGIVPVDSVDAVLAHVERVLRVARDSAGKPIVTAFFRAGTTAGDSLGIGGPTGGDLYFDVAPGYYWGSVATGPMVEPLAFPHGEHGFPSTDQDMHPLGCMLEAGGTGKRIGEIRSIDFAPSVTAWLRISPPADARGRAVWH